LRLTVLGLEIVPADERPALAPLGVRSAIIRPRKTYGANGTVIGHAEVTRRDYLVDTKISRHSFMGLRISWMS